MARVPTVLILALALGCNDTPPPPSKIQVVSPATDAAAKDHASSEASPFDGHKFPCCGSESAKATVFAFAALSEALAADDAALASTRAGELQAAAATASQDSALDEPSRQQAAAVLDIAGRMVALGGDIAGVRAELASAATPAIRLAQLQQGDGDHVVVGFCPMADPPGTWLQVDPVLANPYYGAKMLRCGVFESTDDALRDG